MARLYRVLFLLAGLLLAVAVGIFTLRFPALVVLAMVARLWTARQRWRGSGTSGGTAKAMTAYEMLQAGLFGGGSKSLVFGRSSYADPLTRWQAVCLLFSGRTPSAMACRLFMASVFGRCDGGIVRIHNFTHIATFAPTGKGKGVSEVQPNLLSYDGNMVVIDAKPELFRLTADHRRTKLGHKIFCLHALPPAGVTADRYNPLRDIRPQAADFPIRCRDLANMMIVRTGKEPDPFWLNTAETCLAAFIAYVCACEQAPTQRNLNTVKSLISDRAKYLQAVKVMRQIPGFGGVIDRMGGSLSWFRGRTLLSVMATLAEQTAWMETPAVMHSLAASTFDPHVLRERKATLYICVDQHMLVTLAPLLRVWLGSILRNVTRDGPNEANPILFIVDEAAHIGKLEALENAVTIMRGSGIRLWFFYQSLSQVQRCYGEKAAEILENIGTQQYFAINGLDTAKATSERIGDATEIVESINKNASWSWPTGQRGGEPSPGSYSISTGNTYSETSRRLYKPEELLVLPSDCSLLFHDNLPVIPTRLLRYYDDPAFKNGGTGQDRGPGLAAGVIACLFLSLSLIAVSFVANFEPPKLQQPGQSAQPGRFFIPGWQAGSPPPYGDGFGQGVRPAPQRRRSSQPYVFPYDPPESPYGRYQPARSPYGGGMGSSGYR